nr:reverse transcriptase domain-containing protein [Tanacetum cinerariifolium]
MDYFTKWIEAKPVATITGNQIKKFMWDSVVCRFGVTEENFSDNEKQFRNDPFKDCCEKLCIRQHFTFVKHPQPNGLVERVNHSFGEGIKARLNARSKNWIEELPHVLWAHRTMIKSSNEDTPFSLTYGTEAVIPAEIGMPTLKIAEVDLAGNNETLEINLDVLEERREEAAIREAKSKVKMKKYYNSKVRNTSFKPGDLAYRNNDARRVEDAGKLGPKWEGPYEVMEMLGKGAYELRDCDGKQLPRTWNNSNLKKCHIHKMNPQQKLTPITSPWPFYEWEIDIAGPFPEGPGKVKFLIVAMDYFTKWIEAKPVATITGNQIKKFMWDSVVCRFGVTEENFSDNEKQFRNDPFKDWCEKLCIRQHFTSVKHPQPNGLVERVNHSLGEGIKARLNARSKNWIEELPHVLWAHRTMIKSSNEDTPFSLTYGTEAVISAEIGMPTLKIAEVDLAGNNETLEINLDVLEERREEEAIREAKRDLAYRNNDARRVEDAWKLGPKWEGSYEVMEMLGKGAYELRDCDGKQLPRTWNNNNLKKCHIYKM